MNLVAPEVLGLPAGSADVALRPEDLRVARGEAGPGPDARVWLVEPMGSETWVTVERAGARLVARCDAAFDAPPGAPVRLAFDPSAAALVRPAHRAARARRGRRLRSILASGARRPGRTARAALCGAPGRPDRAVGIHTVYEGPTDPEPTR